MSTIFWYRALRLKGSTVKGRVPVNIAYMFTPLKRDTPKCKIRSGPGVQKTKGRQTEPASWPLPLAEPPF